MTHHPDLTTAAPTDPRRHDLDALRAFAMLLGIALHAALSFMEIPWVVQDQFRGAGFGWFVSVVHGFRMPLFFLLSGFFTAMLWRKRGLGSLLKHRAKRIALPLLLGCLTVVPAMWAVSSWAGSGNTTYGRADTSSDLWTATAYGDIAAVREHLALGADMNEPDPTVGMTPLGWAVTCDQLAVIDLLLDVGAQPSGRYRDQSTPLHTAAFFGRAQAAVRLVDAGAAANARNAMGETPVDSMRHTKGTTEFIAGLLQLPIDFEAVSAGRSEIRELFKSRGAVSGLGQPSGSPLDGSGEAGAANGLFGGALGGLILWLEYFPFFHHLWFLWFLCWLVVGFAIVVTGLRLLPRVALPSFLVATPLCLIWLVPLTMLTQRFMQAGGAMPGFGPDTSAGLLPIPHVLGYYAIFFGFGALVYTSAGAANRLGRGWWIQLPLAFVLLPFALALSLQTPWGRELVAEDATRRMLANAGQVLYTWLMIFGLMGLCETLLHRERPWVRYISDSSYWLYLVHLPLIIVGQALLRDVQLPALVKFLLLLAITTALLLVTYQFMVRYTWLGRLLNGPRHRAAPAEMRAA